VRRVISLTAHELRLAGLELGLLLDGGIGLHAEAVELVLAALSSDFGWKFHSQDWGMS
jgi:hypothetical protein